MKTVVNVLMSDKEIQERITTLLETKKELLAHRPLDAKTFVAVANEIDQLRLIQGRREQTPAARQAKEDAYVLQHGHRSPCEVQGRENGSFVGFDDVRHETYALPTEDDNGQPLVVGDSFYRMYSGNSGYYQTLYQWDGGEWAFVNDTAPWQMDA